MRAHLGPHPRGEERTDVGVDPVGLRQLARGPGEVADLVRVTTTTTGRAAAAGEATESSS